MWTNESMRILFVRDDEQLDQVINKIIDHSKFTITTISAQEALGEIIKQQPDVVLLNLRLKNRNGFQIVRDAKSNLMTLHIPVIVLTKMNTQPYWDEAYKCGASGYAVLGLHDQYLAQLIEKQLSHKMELVC